MGHKRVLRKAPWMTLEEQPRELVQMLSRLISTPVMKVVELED